MKRDRIIATLLAQGLRNMVLKADPDIAPYFKGMLIGVAVLDEALKTKDEPHEACAKGLEAAASVLMLGAPAQGGIQ